MGLDTILEAELPAPVGEGLERLCRRLREALGDELVSVVLYGSFARGEQESDGSDVNVMVVLAAATPSVLERASPAILAGMAEIGLSVMLVTEEDLPRSTDVFPVKFLDLKAHHRILTGRDVVTGLEVARDHLRLRCEQELRNILLRMRRAYVERVQHPDRLLDMLDTAVTSYLNTLAAVLRLVGVEPPMGRRAVAAAAAERVGVDEEVLGRMADLKSGGFRPKGEELRGIYGEFMGIVDRTAVFVDGL